MNNNFTINYMKKDNLEWPKINKDYLNKFFKNYIEQGE